MNCGIPPIFLWEKDLLQRRKEKERTICTHLFAPRSALITTEI